MRLNLKTEKEIAEANLLPAGVYDFEVRSAEDAVSKSSGADMIKLTLEVFDADGKTHILNDYLLDAMPAKLRHAAKVFGLLADYERGALMSNDMSGKTGKIKVGIKKDKSGQYPDQNNVQDYVVGSGVAAPATRLGAKRQMAPAIAGDLDDDIPF